MTAVAEGPGRPGAPPPESQPAPLVRRVAADVLDSPLAHIGETSASHAAAKAKAHVEARFAVAFHRPRNWNQVEQHLETACQRPRFAEEARYQLPRAGETIEGLSIRFAEEAARALGNLLVEAMVTYDDPEKRIVQVSVTDLEANLTWPFDVVVEKIVERRKPRGGEEIVGQRENSEGKRVYRVAARADEVLQTQAQLVAKAARNGILRLLPADMQETALENIRHTLNGQARKAENLERVVAVFGKLGVTREMLEGYLGHRLADITGDEYARLTGFGRAMREGSTSWEQVTADTPKVRKGREHHAHSPHTSYGQDPAPAPATAPSDAVQTTVVRMEEKPPLPQGKPASGYDHAAGEVPPQAPGVAPAASQSAEPAAPVHPAAPTPEEEDDRALDERIARGDL